MFCSVERVHPPSSEGLTLAAASCKAQEAHRRYTEGNDSSSCILKGGLNLEKLLGIVWCIQPKFTNHFAIIKILSLVNKIFVKNFSVLNYNIWFAADNAMPETVYFPGECI